MNEIQPTSKTNRNDPLRKPQAKKQTENLGKPSKIEDKVSLSNIAKKEEVPKRNSSEIRHDLVKKFQGYLKDGAYSIKANEIADKIVQKIKENKNRAFF